jgi:hypothetical protein
MWRGFTDESFKLLDRYKLNDDTENYKKDEFDLLIRDQFKAIKESIYPILNELLPQYNLSDKNALSKHSSRGNKLFHHFWAAIYRESKESKTKDVQLFWRIDPDRFSFGLYVGHEMEHEIFKDIQKNIVKNHSEILKLVSSIKSPRELTYAKDSTHGFLERKFTHEDAFSSDYWEEGKSPNIYFDYSRAEVVSKGTKLIDEIRDGFKQLAKLYSMLVSPSVTSNKVENKVSEVKDIAKKTIQNKNISSTFKGANNIILYGAPGTGKTFFSKRLALEIIGEDFESDDFLDIYDEAVQDGRISFVTFHPNFGYENFVEGIFPKTDEESLIYEKKNGIFKEIVGHALKDLLSPAVRNGSFLSFEEAYELFLEFIDKAGGGAELSTLAHEKKFTVAESETGGLTFTTGSGTVLHCAEKKLRRIYETLAKKNKTNPDRSDFVEDRSLVAYTVVVLRKMFEFSKNAKHTEIKHSHNFDPFELLGSGRYDLNSNPKNFVLIIDEINRGNIPAIFGELITLIEDTKRIGKPEKTLVTLPLSKERFGVPVNLYLIGTMNTADRSVEALDIALRRRFEFKEMQPIYEDRELISAIDGIDVSKMLKVMNERITVLKGKDYVIGHSYFIDLTSISELKHVFKNKVLPLLEEYFFGEMIKIQMVLGKSFVKSKFSQDDLRRLKLPLDLDGNDILTITNMDEWNFKSIYE